MKGSIDPNLLADVKKVAAKLGKNILSRSEYLQYGQFSQYQVYDGGHTWVEICHATGLKSKKKETVTDDEYFNRLKLVFQALGRYPKVSERKRYGLNISKRRYATLPEFIRKAVSLGYVPNLYEDEKKPELPVILPKPFYDLPDPDERAVPPIPAGTKRRKWERIGVDGFPYAPHDELGVVGLFSILRSRGIIKWQIIEMRGGKGIDITCFDDDTEKILRVELKHILSKGSWNHRFDDLDVVVCWENRWPDFLKPVVVLSKIVKEIT
ncbi:MAG: hypothetical protein IMZ53_02400 [Thermoplasmata archaeon]|nr:hypothetical protein [Thermoplasmata archaeon]